MKVPSNVVELKKAPVARRTRMDTLLLTVDTIGTWKSPPFQRPIRVNDKVRQVAEEIKANGGVLPGVLTLGFIVEGPNKGTYVLDGQHRLEAFKISELKEGFADVRIVHHTSMADMGSEFVDLNSQIVRMRPDDVLRGLEESTQVLAVVRRRCPFVGYDNIRRGDKSPVVSMSAVLRCWSASSQESPATGSVSAAHLAQDLTGESAERLIEFMQVALAAWGRGPDVNRLWGNLNLSLCMWLWRRLVLNPDTRKGRAISLKAGEFRNCLMQLAADDTYCQWLIGRNANDRDRPPAYNRIKALFQKRLRVESGKTAKLPQPHWASGMK